jgi:hypothetical protein
MSDEPFDDELDEGEDTHAVMLALAELGEQIEEVNDPKLMVMDETYWPPINPCVAFVKDGKVVRLVPPPERDYKLDVER